jgi:protocatechuate 3,4-dioxygenase beta subunit
VLNKDHEGTIDGETALTADDSYVFNVTATTVLNNQGEVGPFFVEGEYVRSDIRESEPGVEVVLEAQFVDMSTCEPLSGVWFDIWAANSTGVYSGVHTALNGNVADVANLNNTALRGIQPVDDDGVAKFTTIFPGHYAGRTTHIHVILHEGATQLANGTLTGGTVPHIGQFFFDESLITQVEALAPYNTNTKKVTKNGADRVFVNQETEGTTSDPVFNYVLLGDDLADGLFAWIYVGINKAATYTPTYSFELTDHGGVPVAGGNPGPPGA